MISMNLIGKKMTKKDLAFKYVSSSDLKNLKIILHEGNKDEILFTTDLKGCTLLHKALDSADNEMCLRFLLQIGPQLTAKKNDRGETPLNYACGLKHTSLEILKILLEVNPCTINERDSRGCTPLHIVAEGYKLKNAHSNDVAKKATTKLVHDTEKALLLIEKGAIINSKDFNGMTPLHYAIQGSSSNQYESNMKIIELLLNHKAELNNNSGINSIILAFKSYNILEYVLLKDTSFINEIDKNNFTPMQYLVVHSNNTSEILNIISLLVKYGAFINSDTINLAREHNQDFRVIDALLELVPSYDINTRDEQGRTLLIQYSNDQVNVRKLLQRGADVNVIAKDGSTALFTAVSEATDQVNTSKLLLEAHANPLTFNQYNESIISIACKKFITETNKNVYYELLEMLLNLPCFTDLSVDTMSEFNHETHPQIIILKHLLMVGNRIEVYKILTAIMKCNFKTPSLVIECAVNNFDEDVNFKSLQHLNSISCLLNSSLDKILTSKKDCSIKNEILKILDLMILSEFIQKSPVNTISPLTILFSFIYREPPLSLVYHENDNEEMVYGYLFAETSDSESDDVDVNREQLVQCEILNLANYFISNELNVGDMSIEIKNCSDDIKRVELEKLRRLLWLPDALWVAFLRMNVEAVKLLISHWCGPPLALFLFMDNINYNQIMKFLPMFLQYGGIPLGTNISKLLQQFIANVQQRYGQHIILEDDEEIWKTFNEILNSPTSLLNLSRHAVRTHYGERASKQEESLPDLLDKICPPGLNRYLLMKI